MSPSGKIDRQSLPEPERVRPELEREYVAPRNPTEEALAKMCAELLEVDRIGVYDSFFELGGHSLLATQFISSIREVFHIEYPLRGLFEHPTVAELAEEIQEIQGSGLELEIPVIARVSREAHRMKRSVLGEHVRLEDSDSSPPM